LDTANNMLGSEYSINGIVTRGDRIGTRLGFPTINMENDNCLLPHGVYISKVLLNGKLLQAATYVGVNPTFNRGQIKIETHILDFNDDIYNRKVEIRFKKFLRNERKFISEEELISQINEDIESIKFDFKNEV